MVLRWVVDFVLVLVLRQVSTSCVKETIATLLDQWSCLRNSLAHDSVAVVSMRSVSPTRPLVVPWAFPCTRPGLGSHIPLLRDTNPREARLENTNDDLHCD